MVSISQEIYNFAINLLEKSGYFGVFVLMIMEGATLPVPSEVVLPFAGYYLVYQDHYSFWLIVIVAALGTMIGSLIDYGIGYSLGRAAILRYGRFVRLNESHLVIAERWFARYGNATVLLARFVPLIGTLVAFPAGMAEMKIPKFIVFSIVGVFIWDSLLTYVGFVAARNYNAIDNALRLYFLPIGVVSIAVVALVLFARVRRNKKQ